MKTKMKSKTRKTHNSPAKKSKTKTKTNSNRKNNNNNNEPFHFHNVGSTETIIKNNDKITNSSINWEGNYNGKIANIHVSVHNDGRNEDMDIKLDNNDLMHLLGQPVVEEPIDQRLMNDFFRNRDRDRQIPFDFVEQREQQLNVSPTFISNNEIPVMYTKTNNKKQQFSRKNKLKTKTKPKK